MDTFNPDEAAPEMWNEIAAQVEQDLQEATKDSLNQQCLNPHLDPDLLPEEALAVMPNRSNHKTSTISKIHIASDSTFHRMVNSQ